MIITGDAIWQNKSRVRQMPALRQILGERNVITLNLKNAAAVSENSS